MTDRKALLTALLSLLSLAIVCANGSAELLAGAAKIDITSDKEPANDRLYAKALVLKSGEQTAVLVTLDVVAIDKIGQIRAPFLENVRRRIEKSTSIAPSNILINVSHCHGIVCADVEDRTVKVIENASKSLEPVKIGMGTGHEDRVMANRRLRLKDGKEIDVRQAYSLPPDEEIVGVGPVDPQIGVVRIDRRDGTTLAAIYNFAVHPIQGVASGLNTADMTGFASQAIEENLRGDGIAFFIQGCAGDINPAFYKDVNIPRNAEALGNQLGLSTLKALHKIKVRDDSRLRLVNEKLKLPLANLQDRIVSLEDQQQRLLKSLRGTSLNLKTFLPLAVKYGLDKDHPSFYSHRYLHEKMLGKENLRKLDATNRAHMKAYIRNIYTMEALTRLQTNLNLLKKHQKNNLLVKSRRIEVEVVGLRLGDFVLVTFPGELVVQIGLNIKKKSPQANTFVAGYTNGYIYYAPTAKQLENVGGAQEDSECILDPAWQKLFEDKALEVLGRL